MPGNEEIELIVRAGICGKHHSDDCIGCTSSRQFNNNKFDQLRAEIGRLREALARLGSMEAMKFSFVPNKTTPAWFELEARIDFARKALEDHPNAG